MSDTVEPGQKGAARLRQKSDGISKFLQSKRPAEDDIERWVCYRTEATLGFNVALEAGADAEMLERLRVEAECAERLLAVGKPSVLRKLGMTDEEIGRLAGCQ